MPEQAPDNVLEKAMTAYWAAIEADPWHSTMRGHSAAVDVAYAAGFAAAQMPEGGEWQYGYVNATTGEFANFGNEEQARAWGAHIKRPPLHRRYVAYGPVEPMADDGTEQAAPQPIADEPVEWERPHVHGAGPCWCVDLPGTK